MDKEGNDVIELKCDNFIIPGSFCRIKKTELNGFLRIY